MASKTYTIATRAQILSTSKGWLTVQLSDGSTVKARAKHVRIQDEAGGLSNRRIGNRRYDCSQYVRRIGKQLNVSAAGNATMDNGDALAKQLRGAELDEVYRQASAILGVPQTELRAKYKHLNVGMQRMNLGNRMRAAAADVK